MALCVVGAGNDMDAMPSQSCDDDDNDVGNDEDEDVIKMRLGGEGLGCDL